MIDGTINRYIEIHLAPFNILCQPVAILLRLHPFARPTGKIGGQGRSLAQQTIASAKDQANAILENARALSESAIRKSRIQAAKDAKESEPRMIREMAEAERNL